MPPSNKRLPRINAFFDDKLIDKRRGFNSSKKKRLISAI